MNSTIASTPPDLKRALAHLIIAACLCLPLTSHPQQQVVDTYDAEFEYMEHWTAQFPPTEFSEPRADLKDEDVILYYQTFDGKRLGNQFEFYLLDKQTGQFLASAELDFSQADFSKTFVTLKGYTVYRGKIWIVLGEEIEYAVGTKVLVLDYRTGEQKEHIDGLSYMQGRDFSAEMFTVGDYVIASGSAAMQIPSMTRRSDGSLAPALHIFDANTGVTVGRIGMAYRVHNRTPDQEVQKALDMLIDQTLVLGSYAFEVKSDTIEFLDLRDEVLGTYNIGQPHTISSLGEDLYITAWYHSRASGNIGVPVQNRAIYLTRIYRWTPETEPEMLWDSLIYTGVGFFVGLIDDRIVMTDMASNMYLFSTDPRLGQQTVATPFPSDLQFFHPQTGRMLVIAPLENGDYAPALLRTSTALAIIDTHNLISWDKEVPWIIAGEGVIGESTATTPEQVVLTYGTFQVKPTSR